MLDFLPKHYRKCLENKISQKLYKYSLKDTRQKEVLIDSWACDVMSILLASEVYQACTHMHRFLRRVAFDRWIDLAAGAYARWLDLYVVVESKLQPKRRSTSRFWPGSSLCLPHGRKLIDQKRLRLSLLQRSCRPAGAESERAKSRRRHHQRAIWLASPAAVTGQQN
jgi:hypothetical protein